MISDRSGDWTYFGQRLSNIDQGNDREVVRRTATFSSNLVIEIRLQYENLRHSSLPPHIKAPHILSPSSNAGPHNQDY